MWRELVDERDFTGWLPADEAGRRRPRADRKLNDTQAAALLGIDTSTLLLNRERLKIPRVRREVWSEYALNLWLFLNRDAPYRRQMT